MASITLNPKTKKYDVQFRVKDAMGNCKKSTKRGFKRKSDAKAVDMPIFASSITMLGIALFQTIWECNSRYLVVFIPIMILLAADGFFAWRDYLRGERIK